MIYDRAGEWDVEREQYVSSRKCGKPMGPTYPHYPNKAERVLLTKMMQKSGQTEEQVRESKSNRLRLAAAQKSMGSPISWEQRKDRLAYEAKRRRRGIAKAKGVEVWQLNLLAIRS